MTQEEAIILIIKELKRAKNKFPFFPVDPIHAAGIVVEEAGELMQATLQTTYEKMQSTSNMEKEAIQTGAMAVCFLIHIEDYVIKPEQKE